MDIISDVASMRVGRDGVLRVTVDFANWFHLVRVGDGVWLIVSKLFHHAPRTPALREAAHSPQSLRACSGVGFRASARGRQVLAAWRSRASRRLGRKLTLCEALTEAHRGEAFLCDTEETNCVPGALATRATRDIEPPFAAGEDGPRPGRVGGGSRQPAMCARELPGLNGDGALSRLGAARQVSGSGPGTCLTITAGCVSHGGGWSEGLDLRGGWGCTRAGRRPCWAVPGWSVYPFVSGRLNYVPTGLVWGSRCTAARCPRGLMLVSIRSTSCR